MKEKEVLLGNSYDFEKNYINNLIKSISGNNDKERVYNLLFRNVNDVRMSILLNMDIPLNFYAENFCHFGKLDSKIFERIIKKDAFLNEVKESLRKKTRSAPDKIKFWPFFFYGKEFSNSNLKLLSLNFKDDILEMLDCNKPLMWNYNYDLCINASLLKNLKINDFEEIKPHYSDLINKYFSSWGLYSNEYQNIESLINKMHKKFGAEFLIENLKEFDYEVFVECVKNKTVKKPLNKKISEFSKTEMDILFYEHVKESEKESKKIIATEVLDEDGKIKKVPVPKKFAKGYKLRYWPSNYPDIWDFNIDYKKEHKLNNDFKLSLLKKSIYKKNLKLFETLLKNNYVVYFHNNVDLMASVASLGKKFLHTLMSYEPILAPDEKNWLIINNYTFNYGAEGIKELEDFGFNLKCRNEFGNTFLQYSSLFNIQSFNLSDQNVKKSIECLNWALENEIDIHNINKRNGTFLQSLKENAETSNVRAKSYYNFLIDFIENYEQTKLYNKIAKEINTEVDTEEEGREKKKRKM